MTILEILSFKLTSTILAGFKNGYFDPSETKFIAYSVLPLDSEQLESELNTLQSYALDHSGNYQEVFTIDNGDGTFCYKELSQLLEEKTFAWVAIRFYGILYEGDWYTRKEVTFYEKGDEVTIIEKVEKQGATEITEWNQDYFALVPAFQTEIDFDEVAAMASRKLNEHLTLINDWDKVMTYYKTIPKEEIPKRQIPQYCQYREFIGIPRLVAYEKQEDKERLNLKFQTYINQEVFIPFARHLAVQLPADFNLIPFLQYDMNFPLIYPHSKEHVLGVIKVFDHYGNSVQYYFLYLFGEKRIFQWTFPEQRTIPTKAYPIKSNIEALSRWEDDVHFGGHSITMDDKSFWSEYVFKKKNGEYCYLKPIEVENSQKDIYTQW